MLSKEQQYKLNDMVTNYCIGMHKTHKVDTSTITAWGNRYRIVMEKVLQKQNKR